MRPSKKIIEKVSLLSELSYDNVLTITKSGNYVVRTEAPSNVHVELIPRASTITKNTFKNLFVKKEIKYQSAQYMLMVTKTGKVIFSKPKPVSNKFVKGINWYTVNTKNFYKHLTYLSSVSGRPYVSIRPILLELIFCNSKAKWLLDFPAFKYESGVTDYKILLNYKSLSEMRKDLGYGFLTDKTFYNLLTHVTEATYHYKTEDIKYWINKDYVRFLFDVIIMGKYFSLQSRKNIVIALLSLFSQDKASYVIEDILKEFANDITNYIKRNKAANTDIIELSGTTILQISKELLTDLNTDKGDTDTDDDDEMDLPF